MDADEARDYLAEFAFGGLEGELADAVEASVNAEPALQKIIAQYKAMDTLFHAYASATECDDAAPRLQGALEAAAKSERSERSSGRRDRAGTRRKSDGERGAGRAPDPADKPEVVIPAWKTMIVKLLMYGLPLAIFIAVGFLVWSRMAGPSTTKTPPIVAALERIKETRNPGDTRGLSVLLELERDRALFAEVPKAPNMIRATYGARLARRAYGEAAIADLIAYVTETFAVKTRSAQAESAGGFWEDWRLSNPAYAAEIKSPEGWSKAQLAEWLGEEAFEARRYAEAVEHLKETQGSPSAALLAAIALVRLGDLNLALEAAKSVSAGGTLGRAQSVLEKRILAGREYLKNQGKPTPSGPDDLRSIRILMRVGDFQGALDALRGGEDPDPRVTFLQGICLMELGRIEEAAALFENKGTALAETDLVVASYFFLAECRRILGEDEAAMTALVNGAEKIETVHTKPELKKAQVTLRFQLVRAYLEQFGAGNKARMENAISFESRKDTSSLALYASEEAGLFGRIRQLSENEARADGREVFHFDFEEAAEGWSGGTIAAGSAFAGSSGYRTEGVALLDREMIESETVLRFAAQVVGGGTLRVSLRGDAAPGVTAQEDRIRTVYNMPAGRWRSFSIPLGSFRSFLEPHVIGTVFAQARFRATDAGGDPAVLLLDEVSMVNKFDAPAPTRP